MNFGNPLPPPLPIPQANDLPATGKLGIKPKSSPTSKDSHKTSVPAHGPPTNEDTVVPEHKPVHEQTAHEIPVTVHHTSVKETASPAPKQKPAVTTTHPPELLALVGTKMPMIGGRADPRRGMHEDKEHCYKEEAIKRGPPTTTADEYHPYPWNGKYYPACPPNFRPVGCCMCAPTCPQGMSDLGYKCKKDSYMRHGSYWSCGADEETSGDLCFKKCPAG